MDCEHGKKKDECETCKKKATEVTPKPAPAAKGEGEEQPVARLAEHFEQRLAEGLDEVKKLVTGGGQKKDDESDESGNIFDDAARIFG